MIDYIFPPLGGVGAQRTLGFVRHLGEFGWSPVVLTVESGEHDSYDEGLLRAVPSAVRVERTASLEPVRFVKRLLGRGGARRGGADDDGRSGLPWSGPSWIRDVSKWVLFPDRHIAWLPFAVARGVSLSRRHTFDAIYSTSTSVTS